MLKPSLSLVRSVVPCSFVSQFAGYYSLLRLLQSAWDGGSAAVIGLRLRRGISCR